MESAMYVGKERCRKLFKITLSLDGNDRFKLKNCSPFTGNLSDGKVFSFLLTAPILAEQKDQLPVHPDL
jgi:hypothetical protein